MIDWSWNLLDLGARRALRRLSPFNDSFTLDAVGDMLGEGALDSVQALVDQSLLSVVDRPAGVRYRMLETVREFGRMQLIDAGGDAEAYAARRAWAIGYASEHVERLAGTEQFVAIDALGAEEVNLADELRGALADGETDDAVQLLAPLGMFWSIRGEHVRLVTLATAVSDAVGDCRSAAEHARASLPIMERLGARDDEIQLYSLLAMCAVADGRPEDAEAELAQIDRIAEGAAGLFGGIAVWQIGRAELLLERGEREAGLALHRECVERLRALEFPVIPRTGVKPWVLVGEAEALAAHAAQRRHRRRARLRDDAIHRDPGSRGRVAQSGQRAP